MNLHSRLFYFWRNFKFMFTEEKILSLTLEQKVGLVLLPTLRPNASKRFIEEFFAGVEPGGVFLFQGTSAEYRQTIETITNLFGRKMLFATDLESGAGRMIIDKGSLPVQMALGAAGDKELVYRAASVTARDAMDVGINWNFSPVADVAYNLANPIVSTRSFCKTEDVVAEMVVAAVKGMQEHGMLATAKHFPGDGVDDRDQHLVLTENNFSYEQWLVKSGYPFIKAIEAGVSTIMIGHLAAPQLEAHFGSKEQRLPSSVSPTIITKLLRETLGFTGLVITDALDMRGVLSVMERDTAMIAAFNAGADMLLFAQPKRDSKLFINAVNDGLITENRLNEAVERVVRLYKHSDELVANKKDISPSWSTAETVSRDITKKSVRVCRGKHFEPLNFAKGKKVLSMQFRSEQVYNANHFNSLLIKSGATVLSYTEKDARELLMHNNLEEFDAVILSFIFTPHWGINQIRPAGVYLRPLLHFLNKQLPNVIGISFGSPTIENDLGNFPTFINAFSPDTVTQERVYELLDTGR